MLVLSLKLDEKVKIGNDIKLMVLRITPDKVRLGIDAPRDVVIVRESLLENQGQESDPDR